MHFLLRGEVQKTPKLKQTPFADGTGSIGLAPGWRMTEAYRGSCTCLGPNDCAVILGLPWTILRPDSGPATLPSAGQSPIAQVGDLPTALREVLMKRTGGRLRSLRAKPAASAIQGVPAVHFLYEFEREGAVRVGLGYFTTLDYGPSSPSWQMYSSAIIAPKARFMKEAPTMLAMWKSWRPNGQTPKPGSESARFDEAMQKYRDNFAKLQGEFRQML